MSRGARVTGLLLTAPVPTGERAARLTGFVLESSDPSAAASQRGARLTWLDARADVPFAASGPRAAVTYAALTVPDGATVVTGDPFDMTVEFALAVPAGAPRPTIHNSKVHMGRRQRKRPA